MRIKKLVSLFMAVVMLSVCASFPTFSADTHEKLTHLTGVSLVDTDVVHKSFSNPDRLFDGDSSASHANIQGATDPDGNGVFGYMWLEAGDTNYITIDLGGIYDLSQINTYWGWAPQAKPIWNSWEYAVPASYTIYVTNTIEGLESATPVKTVSGLYENSMGIADVSTANFSATGRYVKIVHTFGGGGCFALRELEFFGAEKLPITTLGASIRLEDDEVPTGLRFGASVDKTALGIGENWEYDKDSELEFGFYLLPEEKLGNYDSLTKYLANGEGEALKVVARNILSQNEDSIVYTAVLTKIPESNFETSIVAVPYLRTADTVTYFKETTKSYMDVAVVAKSSYEKGNPNNITKEQYDVLLEITKDYVAPLTYYDIDAAAQAKGLNYNNATLPASIFVDLGENYLGYKIDGTYKVDEDTLRMLTTVDCIGDGKIKWVNFQDCGSWTGNLEQPEYAPVDLLDDPIYMSMVLPSERRCFLETRTNGSFLDVAEDKWVNIMTIGAVYRNLDVEIPDDAEFTLCLSDVNLAVRTTKSDGWYEAINLKVPTVYNHMYYLPWQLSGTLELKNRITYFDDHVEIKLTGADFNGTEAKKVMSQVEQCVYHFWGQMHYFDCKGSEVLGVASSYKVWVKEPEAQNYLVAGIGADWRDANGGILQAFAGAKHAITNTPKTILGHNVEPSRYRDVMDTEKVQEILGID